MLICPRRLKSQQIFRHNLFLISPPTISSISAHDPGEHRSDQPDAHTPYATPIDTPSNRLLPKPSGHPTCAPLLLAELHPQNRPPRSFDTGRQLSNTLHGSAGQECRVHHDPNGQKQRPSKNCKTVRSGPMTRQKGGKVILDCFGQRSCDGVEWFFFFFFLLNLKLAGRVGASFGWRGTAC